MVLAETVHYRYLDFFINQIGDRPEDEAVAHRTKVNFEWAKNWIEQHQVAISS